MSFYETAMYYSQDKDIFSVLGEPEDPSSDWNELRCAQLSGFDYIFLSAKINSKLANKASLSEFILDLYQVMESSHDRAKLYIYSPTTSGRPEFACVQVNWANGLVKDFHISPIKNPGQREFIRTLFEHSGMMAGVA
tara:strand:+ start:811 stop:1221 length:411 start_codon:yes stop_codon:yes gene_type:complete